MTATRLLIGLALAAACSKDPSERKPAKDLAPPAATATPAPAGPDGDALGSLSFQVSGGSPEARAHFGRGLLALHSFWYDEATKQFEASIAADPSLRMAYWGLAMSKSKLLWGDDDLEAARAALRRMPSPEALTAREQAWVRAALALFGDGDVRASRRAFVAAMEQVHAAYPDDESASFLAAALLATSRPDDPNDLELRKRAAALASEVFARSPKHPGAAHYVIHAYDTPELASLALPAAQAYAAIAPAAFHARHMPAHIFSRLGMWKEAVASCQAAWDASVAWVERDKLSPDNHDYHSLSWLVEMNFERGRRTEADAAMRTFADAVRAGLSHQQRATYASQVVSYMERSGDWARVDELLAPLEVRALDDETAAPVSGSAVATAAPSGESCAGHGPLPSNPPMRLMEQRAALGARARAAAMRRDLPGTRGYLKEIDRVDAQLRPFMLATQPKDYAARAAENRVRLEKGLLARARGDDRALLEVLRLAAGDADKEPAGEGTASGFLPHESMAEILLRLERPAEALAEFELVIRKHPGRARSMLGAARAAGRAGDVAGARDRYGKLLALWSEAEEGTDGLAEARDAVAAAR